MNKCKHFKTRKKDNKKEKRIYNYCTLLKQEITFNNCSDCANKEYKISKMHNNCKNNVFKKKDCTVFKKNCAKIKSSKHKLTKATEISMKVKKEVWERDNRKCIYCKCDIPLSCANSHFIKRSQLGLGIPQNIVCACPICHDKYDFGTNIQDMINYTREYLKSKYEVWDEEMLKYRK